MTAYGRSLVIAPLGRVTVEIHSVNRKHLEINTIISKELLRFDADVKKWVAEAVKRGQIIVKINLYFDKICPIQISPNIPLVNQYKDAWNAITDELNLPPLDAEKFLSLISGERDLFSFQENEIDEKEILKVLQQAVNDALSQFLEMKAREGKVLFNEIQTRFNHLADLIQKIQIKAPGATEKYRQRLMQRLEEVIGKSVHDEEKILKEIAIFAEKVDISEEIIRFESHLEQVRELFKLKEAAVGKTLEFILQELNREINTIGSKSSDLDIAKYVIEIKSELEKIREQTQNIE